MRSHILLGAAAMIGLVAADPAFCMQEAPPPTEQTLPTNPANPNPAPMPDPAQPAPPSTQPLPLEMPMPAGEAQQIPPAPASQPVIQNRLAPAGPMATPPDAGADTAVSGGTTPSMMTPQPATKEYPLCSKTLQDNCRNPGEGPKRAKMPR